MKSHYLLCAKVGGGLIDRRKYSWTSFIGSQRNSRQEIRVHRTSLFGIPLWRQVSGPLDQNGASSRWLSGQVPVFRTPRHRSPEVCRSRRQTFRRTSLHRLWQTEHKISCTSKISTSLKLLLLFFIFETAKKRGGEKAERLNYFYDRTFMWAHLFRFFFLKKKRTKKKENKQVRTMFTKTK